MAAALCRALADRLLVRNTWHVSVDLEPVFAQQLFHGDLEMDFALSDQRHFVQLGILLEIERGILLAQLGDRRRQLDFVLAVRGFDGEAINRYKMLYIDFWRRRLRCRKRLAREHTLQTSQRHGLASAGFTEFGLR